MLINDNLIKKYLPKEQSDNIAYAAALYSLFPGGKRIRAEFALQSAKMTGRLDENAERIAVALELIHNYSLIHDDLPCMDNDDIRRGRPTCHKQFGETAAVLAGDALLSIAFEVLAKAPVCTTEYLKAISMIAEKSGSFGMVYGQCLDIVGVNTEVDYLKMITLKTANLFTASITAPSIYNKVVEKDLMLMERFGQNFGLLFQIADDLSDHDGWISANKPRALVLAKEYYNDNLSIISTLSKKYDIEYFETVLKASFEKLLGK